MDNVIILVLFLLASIASWLSKQREMKRQSQQPEWEDEEWKEIEWEIPQGEQKGQPPEEKSAPILEAPDSEQIYDEAFEPSSRTPLPAKVPQKNLSELEARLENEAEKLQKGIRLSSGGDQGSLHKRDKLATVGISVPLRRNRTGKRVSLQLHSNTEMKKAILMREILDRPRAYEI